MPAIAMPTPLSRPFELPIFTSATMPAMMAGSVVSRHVKGLRIPSTSAAMAQPEVREGAVGTPGDCGIVPVSTWPHALHNLALSGFIAPHFEQYISDLLQSTSSRMIVFSPWFIHDTSRAAHASMSDIVANVTPKSKCKMLRRKVDKAGGRP